jgi:DnaD/phage-associated family protein
MGQGRNRHTAKTEEYIESCESYYQDTIAVLKYLGIHRPPTKAELELYRKWHNQWDFSLNAILQACKETTKTSSPNLGYLDKILENLHNLNIKHHSRYRNILKTGRKCPATLRLSFLSLATGTPHQHPNIRPFIINGATSGSLSMT